MLKLTAAFLVLMFTFVSQGHVIGLKMGVDDGVVSIEGSVKNDKISIRKYKDRGVCYTNGQVNGKSFSYIVKRDAGREITAGSLPEIVSSVLVSSGFKTPLSCSVYGLFD